MNRLESAIGQQEELVGTSGILIRSKQDDLTDLVIRMNSLMINFAEGRMDEGPTYAGLNRIYRVLSSCNTPAQSSAIHEHPDYHCAFNSLCGGIISSFELTEAGRFDEVLRCAKIFATEYRKFLALVNMSKRNASLN